MHTETSSSQRSSLWAQRSLAWQLIRRDIAERYRGSLFGIVWAFIVPLLMLGIYTFVFTVVFKARWGMETSDAGLQSFAVILFAGLIVHAFFAEVLTRSPALILSNTNYAKKVIFPLGLLPVVCVASALFHTLISYVILFGAYLYVYETLPIGALWLPIIWVPFILFSLGISWFLASLGVFLRDIAHIMGLFSMALLFLSPIFYPAEALPEAYRSFLALNPLTPIIEQSRAVLFEHKAPNWLIIGAYSAGGAVVAALGWAWFARTRKAFADLL